MAATEVPCGSPPGVTLDRRARRLTSDVRHALRRVAGSLHAVWDGGRSAPGRDWLTRVEDWDHPQAPR